MCIYHMRIVKGYDKINRRRFSTFSADNSPSYLQPNKGR
jgi:hypothetical protein